MASKYVIGVDDPLGVSINGADKRGALQAVRNNLKAVANGSRLGVVTVRVRNAAVSATGTLTLSTASGTVGGVINGVTITVTASGGDTATATAIAAAINASTNALVQNIVTASSSGAVVTVTSITPGVLGNTVTLAASGTGVTASGARLTGGTETFTALTF